jgi:hypothetical protein
MESTRRYECELFDCPTALLNFFLTISHFHFPCRIVQAMPSVTSSPHTYGAKSPASPHSLNRPRRVPIMLQGLNSGSIIGSKRAAHTTRQSVHGRAQALYDKKYHPMDDYIRSRRKRRKVEKPRASSPESEPSEGNSSSSESETDNASKVTPPGERRSMRIASSQRTPLYNTKIHPQDKVLRVLGVARYGARGKKSHPKSETVKDQKEDSSASDDGRTEQSESSEDNQSSSESRIVENKIKSSQPLSTYLHPSSAPSCGQLKHRHPSNRMIGGNGSNGDDEQSTTTDDEDNSGTDEDDTTIDSESKASDNKDNTDEQSITTDDEESSAADEDDTNVDKESTASDNEDTTAVDEEAVNVDDHATINADEEYNRENDSPCPHIDITNCTGAERQNDANGYGFHNNHSGAFYPPSTFRAINKQFEESSQYRDNNVADGSPSTQLLKEVQEIVFSDLNEIDAEFPDISFWSN